MSKRKPAPSNDDYQAALIDRLRRSAPRTEAAFETYGSWEVARSSVDILSKIRYVVTTGIRPFDDIVGGFPVGRITEIFGPEACGKTAMALRTAARARLGHISEIITQEDGSKILQPLEDDSYRVGVLYIDNEQSLDQDEKIVFENKILDIGISRTDTVAGVMRMVEQEIMENEVWAEKDKDRTYFTVIVVDTIASTSTKEDLNAAWGKRDFPRVPGELSRGFSKLVRRVNSSNTSLICTNQVRVNYEAAKAYQGKGSPPLSFQYRSLGGMALKFYATHRVLMNPSMSKYKLQPTAQFPAGLNIMFHTVKNRIRMPQRDGKLILLYDPAQGGYNDAFSTLETFLHYGLVEMTAKEKQTGFTLKFNKFGITPKTFDPSKTETTLEEEEEQPVIKRGIRKDPSFRFRAQWPQFFEQHKADVDLLWGKAVEHAFNTPGLAGMTEEQAAGEEEPAELEDA